ncbi:MAG: hypothetical protein GOMPHAMPRED_005587 [Gomphillus americanus]|uniref:J domain-containing protein n=1 Tax=Gomphillus americanus TaxID=1940652 RepID=A0A8H3FYV9_9LECA|nr:MAG: hypothetical protein GOMPHAMPRED_005587 [Gomphillus americanus]
MTSLDPKGWAHLDLYDMLGVDALSEPKELESAWRKFALKHHPDKAAKDEEDSVLKLFHQGRIAKDILSDPASKTIYDEARAARVRKSQLHANINAERRKLVEDLERREQLAKRRKLGLTPDYDGLSEEEAMARKVEYERLIAIGNKMKEDTIARMTAERRRMREDRKKAKHSEPIDPVSPNFPIVLNMPNPQLMPPLQSKPDVDRLVKARFKRNTVTESVDTPEVRTLFSVFGPIESVACLKDKKIRVPDSNTKIDVGTCGIMFKSIAGAYDAVNEWENKKQVDSLWEEFITVSWGGRKEPDCIARVRNGEETPELTIDERAMIRLKIVLQQKKEKKEKKGN